MNHLPRIQGSYKSPLLRKISKTTFGTRLRQHAALVAIKQTTSTLPFYAYANLPIHQLGRKSLIADEIEYDPPKVGFENIELTDLDMRDTQKAPAWRFCS